MKANHGIAMFLLHFINFYSVDGLCQIKSFVNHRTSYESCSFSPRSFNFEKSRFFGDTTIKAVGIGLKQQLVTTNRLAMSAISSNPITAIVGAIQMPVLAAAIKAVVKLISSCGIGYILSKKGILNQEVIRSLSQLIFFVFQPCFLFANVATTLATTGQGLSKLSILPIFSCVQIFVAGFFASAVGTMFGFKVDTQEGREVKMCSSFANSGPLPLLFADSLFGNHLDPTILPTTVAYISFYLLGWSPMFWTKGYDILAGKAVNRTAVLQEQQKTQSAFRRAVRKFQNTIQSPAFKRIASPPVLGCIVGAFVGFIPPLRYAMIGKNAPLSPIFDSIRSLGTAYLPAAILVLAGSLARSTNKSLNSKASTFNVKTFRKKVAAIMGCRFFIMPLVAAAFVTFGSKIGIIPNDKILKFVLLMEGCMPSAQNSVVILQMEEYPEAAASMAQTLSAVYILGVIPIACLLSVIMQYVGI